MSKSEKVEITIPADLQERLEALPDRATRPATNWTKEMDKALVTYWKVKRHADIAKALGVSPNTALYRYRFLTEGKNGN